MTIGSPENERKRHEHNDERRHDGFNGQHDEPPGSQGRGHGRRRLRGARSGHPLAVRQPLAILAVGVASGVVAGYLLHQYRKEIVLAVSKTTGMGKDFALQQKENLADLMEEAKEQEAVATATASAEAPEAPSA